MFTGIISDVGTVVRAEGEGKLRRFRIACDYDPDTIDIGASIAHAGICLTVIHKGRADHTQKGAPHPVLEKKSEQADSLGAVSGWFEVEAAAETLRLTQAAQWQVGTKLNLERALKMGDELGGHMVTGHVDAQAELVARDEVTPDDANWGATARFTFKVPRPLHRFIAAKGSVTLDGTSLTVNSVEDDQFSVLLIPHTLKVTTWGARKAGDMVHLEIDIMARYAARLAQTA